MYLRFADGFGQAAKATTIHETDSGLVKWVIPAALWRSGGALKVRGWVDIIHVVIHTLIGPVIGSGSHLKCPVTENARCSAKDLPLRGRRDRKQF
jgi:hypothetical protein